jgi:hypothetical protein
MSVRDKELDDLMRRLEDMAMDDNASDLDGNKLFDVLCRVECAEERIAITKQLRIITRHTSPSQTTLSSGYDVV